MQHDLTDPRLMWLKFGLFVVLGLLASTTLLVLYPSLKVLLLLALIVWSFCRAYYFAFYVIEHYIDRNFHFDGLYAFARYALRSRDTAGDEKSSRYFSREE